jgi:hypothetical protein
MFKHIALALVWAPVVLGTVAVRDAAADDLVAAVLPLSRSTQVGKTVTVFATVINSSGRALSGCTASLPNFPGTFAYQTTNSATNAVTGSPNTPFGLPSGGSQSLVLALTPTTEIAPTEENFVFQCSSSAAAASIIGVNTLLVSADTSQPADVVALAATPTQDGVLRLPGTGSKQAFAVATVNLGITTPITVTVDWGDITLPINLTICQTNPTTGSCLATPSASVTAMVAANTTPTFGFFAEATAELPFFPSHVRAFVRFKDPAGNVRGSTSIALTTKPVLSPGQTAGGFYTGIYRLTSGPHRGAFGVTKFLISEDGESRGVTYANQNTIDALFYGNAILNTNLLYGSGGTLLAALGYVLDNGTTAEPLSVLGAVSPHNFLAGLYALPQETGEFYAQYDAAIYEQPSSLAAVSGRWTIRNLSGTATGVLTVNPNGSFTGSDSLGCGYSGTISIIDSRYNAYRVNLNVSNCGATSGAYEGLSGLTSTLSANDTLTFALSDPSFAEVNSITRF